MEKENKAKETVEKPSSQDICQIFMQYWGQKFKFMNESEIYTICGCVNFHGWNVIPDVNSHNQRHFAIKSVSILVKPLEKISTADCREVFKIAFGDYIEKLDPKRHPYGYTGSDHDEVATKLVKDYLFGRNPVPMTQSLVDSLREMGYALSYKEFSVENLVQIGIYKLIE